MPLIKVFNTNRYEEDLTELKKVLEGKTYLNLEVLFCPVGGSFDVCVQTRENVSKDRLRNMVMYLLAENLIIGGK